MAAGAATTTYYHLLLSADLGGGLPVGLVGERLTQPRSTRTPSPACRGGAAAREVQSKGRGNASAGETMLKPSATGDSGSIPIEGETVELLGIPKDQQYYPKWRRT